ncbi:MAG TPA: hypothetical protein VE956_22925 [Nodularia sp. (in: cyanobacteria)]|nr:hypothetical protein [Nodularia sp. (in: cyanobacteria)]
MQDNTVNALYSLVESALLLRQVLTSLEASNRNKPSRENEDLIRNIQKSLSEIIGYISSIAVAEGIDIKGDNKEINLTKLAKIINLNTPDRIMIDTNNWSDIF